MCATAEALFGPFVQTLESEFDKAYKTRNNKDVRTRAPPPEWMRGRNSFVWYPPNPTMLAVATTQDFQRPSFWVPWLPEFIWCHNNNKAYRCNNLICPKENCGGIMAAQKWVRVSVVGIGGMGMASTKNYREIKVADCGTALGGRGGAAGQCTKV